MLDPDAFLVEPSPEGKCPRMFLRANQKEWLQYLARLSDAEMLISIPVDDVPLGPNGEHLGSGAFPVGKSAEEDRAVTDRRPKNWGEKKLRAPRLPIV